MVVVRAASRRRRGCGGGHRGLHLHALGVLPLAFVRILVAPERLRRREVPAAVVALELAAAAAAAVGGGPAAAAALRGGSGGGSSSSGRGIFIRVSLRWGVRDVDAEDADAGVVGASTGRGGGALQERKLGEGRDVAEVTSRLPKARRAAAAAAVSAFAAAAHAGRCGASEGGSLAWLGTELLLLVCLCGVVFSTATSTYQEGSSRGVS